jgi:excisionase family DNA binding protein
VKGQPELLTIRGAAKLLNISEGTLRWRIKRGEIETVNAGLRGVMIPREAIARYALPSMAQRVEPDDHVDPVERNAMFTRLARQAVRESGGKVHPRVEEAAPLTRKTPPQMPVTSRDLKTPPTPADPALVAKARKSWLACERKLRAICKQSKVTDRQAQAWIVQQLGVWQLGAKLDGIDRSTARELVEKAEIKLRPGGHLDEAREILEAGLQEIAVYPLTGKQYDRAVVGPGSGGGRSVKQSLAVAAEVAATWLERPTGGGRHVKAHDAKKDYDGKAQDSGGD